jgi:hypothetical protein
LSDFDPEPARAGRAIVGRARIVKRKYVGNCMVVVLVLKLNSLEVMCLGCSWRRKKSEGQVARDFILL